MLLSLLMNSEMTCSLAGQTPVTSSYLLSLPPEERGCFPHNLLPVTSFKKSSSSWVLSEPFLAEWDFSWVSRLFQLPHCASEWSVWPPVSSLHTPITSYKLSHIWVIPHPPLPIIRWGNWGSWWRGSLSNFPHVAVCLPLWFWSQCLSWFHPPPSLPPPPSCQLHWSTTSTSFPWPFVPLRWPWPHSARERRGSVCLCVNR